MDLKARSLFLNRYWIIGRMGSGGFGQVYRATDTLLFNREVAIKVLGWAQADPGDKGISEFKAMARMEAEAQARLTHPGVVKLLAHGFDVETAAPYLVTELIPGHTLRWPAADWGSSPEAWLKRCRPFLDWMDQLLDILVSVHGQGVIHGDLSPENVVLQETGGQGFFVRVLDFGLARMRRRYGLQLPGLGTRITHNQEYSAPELEKEHPTALSDQYSVGLMLQQGLGGGIPLHQPGMKPKDHFVARCARDLPALEAPVPPALAEVVRQATRRQPERRHAEMAAMAEAYRQALAPVVGDTPLVAQARPAAPPSKTQDIEQLLVDGLHSSHLHFYTMVLPSGASLEDPLIGPIHQRLEQLVANTRCTCCRRNMRLVTLHAGQLQGGSQIRLDVERLEFARLVLWVMCDRFPLPTEEHRLVDLLHREGRALVLRLVEDTPGPLQTYSPQVHLTQDSDHPGWAQIQQALERHASWPWLTYFMTEMWFASDQISPLMVELLGEISQGHLDSAIHKLDLLLTMEPAVAEHPLLLLRLAMMMAIRDRADDLPRVVEILEQVAQVLTDFAPVWRQLGITWRRLGHHPRSQQCLEIACGLSPLDWNALSSLGGARRGHSQWLGAEQQQQYKRALESYDQAWRRSGGNAYPVLNTIRLRAIGAQQLAPTNSLSLSKQEQTLLARIVRQRGEEARMSAGLPWSLFDQVEALLYLERDDVAREVLVQGPRDHLTAKRRDIFLATLDGLLKANIRLPGLEAIRRQVAELDVVR